MGFVWKKGLGAGRVRDKREGMTGARAGAGAGAVVLRNGEDFEG